MGHPLQSTQSILARHLAAAGRGDPQAYFDLGMIYAAGAAGIPLDLIEAHKWFNLAAVGGHRRGQESRAEIAEEMTAREIVEAQKRARAWLGATMRQAA